jgi:hypothetical protein
MNNFILIVERVKITKFPITQYDKVEKQVQPLRNRTLSSHVYVKLGVLIFPLFLRFFYLTLELFWGCYIFFFHFIDAATNSLMWMFMLGMLRGFNLIHQLHRQICDHDIRHIKQWISYSKFEYCLIKSVYQFFRKKNSIWTPFSPYPLDPH